MKSLLEITLARQARGRGPYADPRLELKPLKGKTVRVIGELTRYNKNGRVTRFTLANVMVNDSIAIHHMVFKIPTQAFEFSAKLDICKLFNKRVILTGVIEPYKRRGSHLSSYGIKTIQKLEPEGLPEDTDYKRLFAVPNKPYLIIQRWEKLVGPVDTENVERLCPAPDGLHFMTAPEPDENGEEPREMLNLWDNNPGFIVDWACRLIDNRIAILTKHPEVNTDLMKTIGEGELTMNNSRMLTKLSTLIHHSRDGHAYKANINLTADDGSKFDLSFFVDWIKANLTPVQGLTFKDARFFYTDHDQKTLYLVMGAPENRSADYILRKIYSSLVRNNEQFKTIDTIAWVNTYGSTLNRLPVDFLEEQELKRPTP